MVFGGSKMAEYGATVVVSDPDIGNVRNTVAELQSEHSEATFGAHEVYVTRVDSVESLVGYTVESFGRIDILVNNAAIIGAPGWETRDPHHPHEDDWDQIYAVNVKGVAKMSDRVAEFIKPRRYGKIVNIASIAGRQGDPVAPADCASKASVISLTQVYALGLAPYNINVNAICPGMTWTAMRERIADRDINLDESQSGLTPRERFDRSLQETTPLGREMTLV